MGIGVGLLVKDARIVEAVDADIAGGMDDAAIAEADADMDDTALVVLEEAEVVLLKLLERGDGDALGGLLGGIAQEGDATSEEADLGEPGAVDAHDGAPSPEIGGAKIAVERHLGGRGGRDGGSALETSVFDDVERDLVILLVVHPAFVAVEVATDARPLGGALKDLKSVAHKELVDHLGSVGGL